MEKNTIDSVPPFLIKLPGINDTLVAYSLENERYLMEGIASLKDRIRLLEVDTLELSSKLAVTKEALDSLYKASQLIKENNLKISSNLIDLDRLNKKQQKELNLLSNKVNRAKRKEKWYIVAILSVSTAFLTTLIVK